MEKSAGCVTMCHGETRIDMTRHTASLMISEWAPVWERFYLPPFPIQGKTVLDAGAGSGETAYFYLLHRAKKVIAVEKDEVAVRLLRRNVDYNKWDVEIVHGEFDLKTFEDHDFDFMKMDIEGGESILLEYYGKLKPSVIEAHGEELQQALIDRFGLACVGRVWKDRYLLRTRDVVAS